MRNSLAALAALALASCGGRDQAGNVAAESAAAGEAASGAGSAAASFQPGQWETTTEVTRMNMAGMPAGVAPPMPPPTTVSFCMTPAQSARPDANFLTGSSEGSGCSYSDFSMAGGRIRGTVQCAQQGTTMHTTMDGQFSADSYQITQQVRVTAAGVSTDMESRTTGRRVGDCPAN